MSLVDWLFDKRWNIRGRHRFGGESGQSVFKQKVKISKNRKFFFEEVQHLRRCGINITSKINSVDKGFIRRFANWWESTFVEDFLEDIEYLLQKYAFLSIVSLLAQVTIIISLFSWWSDRIERRENELFATWQIINDAKEDKSGVVKVALERLLRNDFSLAGLYLKGTNLSEVNLQEANLYSSNLQGAVLSFSNLQEVNLSSSNLQNALLIDANLQGANLFFSNLQQAYLSSSNLQGANLLFSNLQQAYLWEANLQEARLYGANLQQAYLVEARNYTYQQIKSACFWDKAIYVGELKLWVESYGAKEPDNTNFIEELKKDMASDPEESVDCSRWDN